MHDCLEENFGAAHRLVDMLCTMAELDANDANRTKNVFVGSAFTI